MKLYCSYEYIALLRGATFGTITFDYITPIHTTVKFTRANSFCGNYIKVNNGSYTTIASQSVLDIKRDIVVVATLIAEFSGTKEMWLFIPTTIPEYYYSIRDNSAYHI